MQDGLLELAASRSFSGSPSNAQVDLSRSLKRRLTSVPELPFFTPAASSFKPRPFSANPAALPKLLPGPAPTRAPTLPLPPMDPTPSDPNAIFLHPPFNIFPNSQYYPEGLCYSVLAANPDWFLDPLDFKSETNPNTNAILYPAELEPPRGWCPAKKKELKERGTEGWPEGEEPRLRCTFCRRTYAGVNAKSMWRRHVFEKHKIAMSNRRDNAEKGRGRSTSKKSQPLQDKEFILEKENLTFIAGSSSEGPHGGQDHVPARPLSPSLKYYRTIRPDAQRSVSAPNINFCHSADSGTQPSSSQSTPNPEVEEPSAGELSSDPHHPPDTPPLTPRSLSPESATRPIQEEVSDGKTNATTPFDAPTVPFSPYNPLLTPSFRHSPARPPSPWRFKSPSHPLHSDVRELCLSMIAQGGATASDAKGIDSSPSPFTFALRGRATPSSSPKDFGLGRSSSASELGDSPIKFPSSLARPSPRRIFSTSSLPAPLTDRIMSRPTRKRNYPEASPLSRVAFVGHSRSLTNLKDAWTAGPSSLSPLRPSRKIQSTDNAFNGRTLVDSDDPFVDMYDSWVDLDTSTSITDSSFSSYEETNSPVSTPESESPVLRSTALHDGHFGDKGSILDITGLGIGLLEPFSLDAKFSAEPQVHGDVDIDLAEFGDLMYPSPRRVGGAGGVKPVVPMDEVGEPHAPPMKRRKTLA
ncbi:hypothetical protein JAAARDRAFT_189203 [Jaapia argillacea MUCL 33604]|uniref:Uncharacterized protein n=1 Tax=Jaapia argillacea MUCL 33604 TaxID=933084 RepID=A0A067QJF5_9AGAM|nr:hypothetical protein JAAARDRAFT_189203 [Jaapia argillacea MUCL 33604]